MSLPTYPTKGVTRIRSILAVASGKGGVGKSSVTVQLAHAFSAMGLRIGILDSDLYGPSIRKMIPEDEAITATEEGLFPARAKGIVYHSLAFFRAEDEATAIRAPIANQLLQQLIHETVWGELDLLLIDFPPGTGDIQLTLAQQLPIDASLLVTTPQEVSLLDVQKTEKLFDLVHIPILGLIENLSFYQPSAADEKVYLFGRGGGARYAHDHHIPYLGEIAVDPLLSQCGDEGKSLSEVAPDSPLTQRFAQLARDVWEGVQREKERAIASISQQNPHTVTIAWKGGQTETLSLASIQRHCPCAACSERPPTVDEGVTTHLIKRVGHYALRFSFSSGCSHGIYPLTLLTQIATQETRCVTQ